MVLSYLHFWVPLRLDYVLCFADFHFEIGWSNFFKTPLQLGFLILHFRYWRSAPLHFLSFGFDPFSLSLLCLFLPLSYLHLLLFCAFDPFKLRLMSLNASYSLILLAVLQLSLSFPFLFECCVFFYVLLCLGFSDWDFDYLFCVLINHFDLFVRFAFSKALLSLSFGISSAWLITFFLFSYFIILMYYLLAFLLLTGRLLSPFIPLSLALLSSLF